MKLIKLFNTLLVVGAITISVAQEQKTAMPKGEIDSFSYVVEQFADINVLRYQISSWDNLTLKEKQLVEVFNTIGQLVLVITEPTTAIDVSSLKTGNYFIKVISDKGTSSSSFIKE